MRRSSTPSSSKRPRYGLRPISTTSRTAIDYGLYGVPETFFIGRDGRVARKHVGPVTRDVLVRTLDSLLATPADTSASP